MIVTAITATLPSTPSVDRFGRVGRKRGERGLGPEIEMSPGVVSQTGAHFVVGICPEEPRDDRARIVNFALVSLPLLVLRAA